jgi:hypothetical protein
MLNFIFLSVPWKEIKVSDYGKNSLLPELVFSSNIETGEIQGGENLLCLLEQCTSCYKFCQLIISSSSAGVCAILLLLNTSTERVKSVHKSPKPILESSCLGKNMYL